MDVSHLDLQSYSEEDILLAFEKTEEHFKTLPNLDFDRIKGQIEVGKKTLQMFKEGKDQVIINAPTGFGKSILAFFITEVFKHLCSNKSSQTGSNDNVSYILTSNKYLQEQYDKDIKLFRLNHIMLKGQGNYSCAVNPNFQFPKADCKDESTASLMNTGAKGKFPCFMNCEYLTTRRKAISAHSTVFNYSYFLTTMNNVYARLGEFAPFHPRLLTIFDECHVLGNVVNDMFTVEFNINQFIRRTALVSSLIRNNDNKNIHYHEKYNLNSDFWNNFVELFNKVKQNQDEYLIFKPVLENLTGELFEILKELSAFINPEIKVEEGETMNQYQKDLNNYLIYFGTFFQGIKGMMDTYESLGYETAVIQYTQNDFSKIKTIEKFGTDTDFTMKMQCTDESSLIQRAAISFTKYSILMSATIGNPEDYGTKIGCTNFGTIDVESDFDYSTSPIYMVQPMISMNYNNKVKNMPIMMQRILKIINDNPGVRGLIHTGNFEIMNQIKKLNNPRVLTYENSAEKSELLKLLHSKPDAIIVGPSLIEGIDLKDDLCRFMIYCKVPFLSLGDKLVKRKMEIYKGWYDFETAISFLQGLGRPNRHKKDWCKTYLLDESFVGFFRRYRLPLIVKNRIIETHIDSLGESFKDKSDEEFEKMLREMEG